MLQEPLGGRNHRWLVLATVGIGILMATIDVSIVNIALPTILTHFRADLASISWVVLAYLLTVTALLLPFGRLSDMLGRKRVYVGGFVLFTVGSGLCGGSGSVPELITFRVVQGVGAAMLTANGFAIVAAAFSARQRGTALGISGTVVAIGIILGPTLGGLLIDSLGWRWIFLVNLPIGAVGTAASLAILSDRVISIRAVGDRQQFDFAGAIASGLALFALLATLSLGPEAGWSSPATLLLLALFALLLGLFLLVESRVEQPMVDLRLFRDRTFSIGNLAGLIAFLSIAANSFLMPFFLQVVLGYSPTRAGLLMTPTALVMAVVAPASGWLSDRLGTRALSSAGLAVNCLGLLLLGNLTVGSQYGQALVGLLLLGLGHGLFQSPNNSSVLGAVPRERYGIAAGVLSMMRNVGSVIGVAVVASLLLGSLSQGVGHTELDALLPGETGGGPRQELLSAFVAGLRRAYLVAAAFAGVGALATLAREERRGPPARDVDRRAA